MNHKFWLLTSYFHFPFPETGWGGLQNPVVEENNCDICFEIFKNSTNLSHKLDYFFNVSDVHFN